MGKQWLIGLMLVVIVGISAAQTSMTYEDFESLFAFNNEYFKALNKAQERVAKGLDDPLSIQVEDIRLLLMQRTKLCKPNKANNGNKI